ASPVRAHRTKESGSAACRNCIAAFRAPRYRRSSKKASTRQPGGRLPMPDQKKKPNILIIWGDDIGWFNVSMNNNGIMGYRTPNIDRIAKEGCNFTDWYGQQSCTAGRAA